MSTLLFEHLKRLPDEGSVWFWAFFINTTWPESTLWPIRFPLGAHNPPFFPLTLPSPATRFLWLFRSRFFWGLWLGSKLDATAYQEDEPSDGFTDVRFQPVIAPICPRIQLRSATPASLLSQTTSRLYIKCSISF
jgi:hypothetical protein